jgi:ribosomal protein L33
MPDVNGKLSQDEKDKILDWVKTKASQTSPYTAFEQRKNLCCQVCGSQNWTIAEHLVTPTVLNVTGVGLMNPYYPQAMLICTECGSTVYVNVGRLGLIQS